MIMREVKNFDELKNPGDYMLTTRCKCGAEGEKHKWEVKLHYQGCQNPESHTGFILVCRCRGTFCSHPDHRVLNRNPLTVVASWLCPNGCHVFITNGVFPD